MRYKDSHTSVEISLESSLISHHISLIIALACIAVYMFALIFAGIRVYHMVSGQRSLAQQEFKDFVTYATTEGNRSFMSERFHANITNALKSSNTLQAAIISNVSNEYGFERSRESGIAWNGEKLVFKATLGLSQPLFAALAIENQRNVAVRVIYNFFDYKRLIIILKQTLAIVVIGLCISCITLLLRYLLVKDTVPVTVGGAPHKKKDGFDGGNGGDTVHVAQETDDEDSFSDIFDMEDSDGRSNDYHHAEAAYPEPAVPPSSLFEGEIDNMPLHADISEDEFAGLFPKEDDEPAYTELGVNREENLIRKIEDELYRSEAFNQDLALIAIETSDDPDGTMLPDLVTEAIDFFVLRDLIFEKGGSGIAVIAQNMDIDAAFSKAAEFRAALLDKRSEQNINLFIGVSSRCGRDEVEPDRLIREADAALEKASETAPVVAFRVDPEKYKEFLRKQGAS
ncbi:MAG: hypothetical protein LBK73_01245 [Treponema sp.]|jgi:hypothetical protein|nr:hypothetical protein [Treponema sp.]